MLPRKFMGLDASILIELKNGKGTQELKRFFEDYPEHGLATLDEALIETIGVKNLDNKITDIDIDNILYVFREYTIYQIIRLNESVKDELCGKTPKLVSNLIDEDYIKGFISVDLKEYLKSRDAYMKDYFKGTGGRLSDNKYKKISSDINKIKEDIFSYSFPISIILPEIHKKLEEQNHELFKNKLKFAEAIKVATKLVKKSSGKFSIIMINEKNIYWLRSDLKNRYIKHFENLEKDHPKLFSMILYSKIIRKYELDEDLKENTLIDIEILTHTMHACDLFLSSDVGQLQIASLIFPEKIDKLMLYKKGDKKQVIPFKDVIKDL